MTNAKQSIEIIEGLTVELTPEQLEEVSRKLQSAKDKARKGAMYPKPKVGDWIRAIGDGVGITDGKAYEVFDNTTPGFARVIDDYGNKTGVPYGDFEITEKPKLKVGDWVRFTTISPYAVSGKAYKVIRLDNGSPEVIDEEGTPNTFYCPYEIIDKLTPFDRAGRKPGEFKVGDIVRVTDPCSSSYVDKGDIVEVLEPRNIQVAGRSGYTPLVEAELVTPVESRVDRAEGADVA